MAPPQPWMWPVNNLVNKLKNELSQGYIRPYPPQEPVVSTCSWASNHPLKHPTAAANHRSFPPRPCSCSYAAMAKQTKPSLMHVSLMVLLMVLSELLTQQELGSAFNPG